MAGDWIKLELVTPDKPEIHSMAECLQIPAEQVLGGLCRIWIWADQQSINGNALSVTENAIDRISRVAGLAKAMRAEGWITGEGGNLALPNFDRHNGKTAKQRALSNKRVETHRKQKGNCHSVTDALPEKRREEVTPHSPSSRKKPASRAPDSFEITEQLWSWAREQGVAHERIEPETAKFLDHHKSKDSSFSDWPAAWRKWMRNVVDFAEARH